jgi:ribosomal protein L36
MNIISKGRPICDHCRVIRRDGKVLLVHYGTAKCAGSDGEAGR